MGNSEWSPTGGNGGSLTSVHNAGVPNGTDDTAAIQAALNAAHTSPEAKGIVFVPDGEWQLSDHLIIYSNTELWLSPGATITLQAGSNCQMIVNNAWVTGVGTDYNIDIHGGTWTRANGNAAGATMLTLHSMIFQRVTNLKVHDLNANSSDSKFFVNVYACSDFDVGRITFNTASDGVHLSGTCANGYVHDIYGTTGDDTVALTPVDYTAYNNGDLGNMSGITVERIFAAQTNAGNGVRLIAGNNASTPVYIYDTKIADVYVTPNTGAAARIGGDAADPATTGGYIEGLTVDGMSTASTSAGHLIIFTAGTMRGVKLRRLHSPQVANSNTVYFGATSSVQTVVEDITLEDCYFNPPASTYVINFQGAATYPKVTTLQVQNVRLNVASATAGLINTSNASCTLTNIFIDGLIADQCAWAIVDLYCTTNLWVENATGSPGNGLANIRTGATLSIQRATGITGAKMRTISNAGTKNGMIVSQGTGAPAFDGSVGDLYDRQDGGSGTYRYRCTTAGAAGAAVWTGIL